MTTCSFIKVTQNYIFLAEIFFFFQDKQKNLQPNNGDDLENTYTSTKKMASVRMRLIVSLIVVVGVALFRITAADTYTVGDELGWTVPPAGSIAYSTWARTKNFEINDTIGKIILRFYFIFSLTRCSGRISTVENIFKPILHPD